MELFEWIKTLGPYAVILVSAVGSYYVVREKVRSLEGRVEKLEDRVEPIGERLVRMETKIDILLAGRERSE